MRKIKNRGLKWAVHREGGVVDFYETKTEAESAARNDDESSHCYVMHIDSMWQRPKYSDEDEYA